VQALRGDYPVIFLMHKRLSSVRGEVEAPLQPIPFGKAAIAREGSDVTLVTYSFTVRQALEAAEAVAADGISVEVVDLRTVAPLDRETINESVRKTGRVVLLSDAPIVGGVLAEVAAGIQESVLDYLDAPIVRLGGRHSPIPHSPPLFEALVPSLESVSAALREIVGVTV
jgi:pyruvate/2-oxoglutarate/acetoin dehydrogenase E1 component